MNENYYEIMRLREVIKTLEEKISEMTQEINYLKKLLNNE